jgi:Carboxypeptidase regulatory-like domain
VRYACIDIFGSLSKSLRSLFVCALSLAFLMQIASAQQTLGSINGAVADSSGAVVPGVNVKVRAIATNLEVTAQSKNDGSFSISDLPIGTYEVRFAKDGFETAVYPQIIVQGDRTATVNAKLKPGSVSTTVTVEATPMLNQTDTTNGYTLGAEVIESTPLGTGSFTQLAILAPGVSADLLGGSGTNTGLGNQNIFANGQRSTSNSFAFNGVNSNNLFNGNSSSQVGSNRYVLSTGENFLGGNGEDIQTSTSVYDAIGQGLPTPPPETIQELNVSTSMYDASQGANSGAHIELVTKSGTNDFHGEVYEYHQTSAWNAVPYFRTDDPSISASDKVPKLHYNKFGGLLGGPIKKDKLFFFGSYQGTRVSDELNATSSLNVPLHLTDDRSAAGLAAAANTDFGTSLTGAQIDPVALALMQSKSGGTYLVPTPTITDATTVGALGHDVLLQGVSRFTADQVNANVDYNFSAKDRLAEKYYYQRDPTSSPFAISGLLGFPQSLDAGSQVISLDNTTVLSPNLTWEQRAGFIREKAFANTAQPLTPSSAGINLFGSNIFPGISINNTSGNTDPNVGTLSIGPTSPFANAGVFQNQWEITSRLGWVRGRHNVSAGFQWDRTQLNIENKNNQAAGLSFADFPSFLTGTLQLGEERTAFFNGASDRHYRANQFGAFLSDSIKITHNLTLTTGLRFDWDGPLSEKNGLLTNFYPSSYHYTLATDSIDNNGLVVAGNNREFCQNRASYCASNSTLTGRQWGLAPRIGLAWSPSFVKNFVVRTGFGLYYDRGQFFTEYSPSAGFGFNGPFGVTLEPPFVVPCVPSVSPTSVANCGPGANNPTFSNPFGTSTPPPPPNNFSSIAALLPNQAGLEGGSTPFLFGGYDPSNKLPYSENWTLDFQWQPRNTIMLDLAYVGNHGVHGTMPIPFNEPRIATATNVVNGQSSSYGYQVPGVAAEQFNTSTGGNTDLRVPFIGYSPNSVFYEAIGIAHYDALQFGVTKRLSHGLQVNGSYTWSHSLDEQSGLGLFYNGSDPLNPRSAYGNSDFDRTHVFVVSYLYQFPKVRNAGRLENMFANGWEISGITVLESGQPYSVVDYSGGVGSIVFSTNDFITNPIVPIGGVGATATNARLQGTTGVNANNPVLNVNAFGVPLLQPGQDGVPAGDFYETGFGPPGRNIFRGPFQNRFDFGVSKNLKINERFTLRYDAQLFNIFNHPSFDTPNNDVAFNPFFSNPPTYGFGGFPACVPSTSAYNCPPSGSLGIIQHTLGSPRFAQMALHLTF